MKEEKSQPNPDWVINPEWLALEGKPYGVLMVDPSMRPYEVVNWPEESENKKVKPNERIP